MKLEAEVRIDHVFEEGEVRQRGVMCMHVSMALLREIAVGEHHMRRVIADIFVRAAQHEVEKLDREHGGSVVVPR